MNITSGKCKLKWDENGKLVDFAASSKEEYVGFVPFKLCVAGESEGQFSELTSANCLLSEQFRLAGKERKEGATLFSYFHDGLKLREETEISPVGDTGVFVCRSRLFNESGQEIVVNAFSSAFLSGMGGGIGESAPPLRAHWFEAAWHAEARHRSQSVRELGLTYVSPHFMSKSFVLSSHGGYTTAKYFPSLYLEDTRKKKIWFINAECEGNWNIGLGHAAAYAAQKAGWYLESRHISASDLGAALVLRAGERYEAPAVLFGAVAGGIDEATEALTRARRVLYKKETAPLMFNDYMNCLWSDVTEDKILTLAKKAAALGAEGYCIDCGWYAPSDSLYGGLGDWKESPDRFPKLGLRGVLKEIQKLGLVAGVWTELELCSENAEAFSFPDEYFICEHGKRVGGGERYFFDFSNPDVRTYLFERVKALYDMGVRYIKNDFNAAIRWTTLSDVIAKNHRAAMAFYDGLKAAFPDLYLENCGSGAMRSDYGTLKHFCLQSTSDQELYYLNPPIAQGTLANILPEQAGIWAYPYPNLFDVRADARAMEEEAARQKGGRQTIFNLVNGIAGNLYLSGRIDYADEENAALIAEGVRYFKSLRPFKARASAVYPVGFADISDLGEFTALGLIDDEKTKLVLFFWRFGGNGTNFRIPLKKWLGERAEIARAYPERDCGVGAMLNGKSLDVTAREPYSAAIFEIALKKEKI